MSTGNAESNYINIILPKLFTILIKLKLFLEILKTGCRRVAAQAMGQSSHGEG